MYKGSNKGFRSKGLINSMEKGPSVILRKLRAVRDMQMIDFNDEKNPTPGCFSRLFGRKGGNGVNTGSTEGGLGSVCFFPWQQRVRAGSGSRDVKKGGNAVIVLPPGLKSSSFVRSVTNGRLKGKMGC